MKNTIMPVLYGSIFIYAAHTTNYSTPLLSAHKNKTRAYLSENVGLGKKKSGEWAKSRKGSGRKTREDV